MQPGESIGVNSSLFRIKKMLPPLTPRPLSDPLEIQRRLGLLHEPHISELTHLVEQIHEVERNHSVPWFDPMGGGVNAKVLLLLQDPSDTAQNGTGFISPDNPDVTANNTTWFRDQARILPHELIHWNVIPWMMRNTFAQEMTRALKYLIELRELLLALKVVICMGNNARDGWNRSYPGNKCKPGWLEWTEWVQGGDHLAVVNCPHPSHRGIGGANGTRIVDDRTPLQRIIDTLNNVRFYLDN